MAGKESRQCPHFKITDGVCGCPEFWRPVQGTQHGRSQPALQETPNERYSQNAPNRLASSSVNSIPLPDRMKIQQMTPAPSGPPKETCFFWYHGSCRRGGECDRPHEAHPTWPIPPPPGFRHYQPCMLPLCPLRSALGISDKSQEFQRYPRTIGGQLDGSAFSRATTAGESSSDKDTTLNTDTDVSETAEDIYLTSDEEILGLYIENMSVSQGYPDKERAAHADEVRVQEMGKSHSDEPDYVELPQLPLPSPPATPLLRDTLLSISHPGTLSKRRHSPATNSPRSYRKRARVEEADATELDNVVPLSQRPRKMSQWDKRSRNFGLDGQHSEPAAPYSAALYNLPTQSEPRATNDSVRQYTSPPFDPPRGPRSTSALPPICFFFYHKGYCNPKKGRSCDYLHDTRTAQQTVSLPYGIGGHDPLCPLLECPIRLRRAGRVKEEEGPRLVQPKPKREPPPSIHVSPPPSLEVADSFSRDLTTSIRSQPQRQMIKPPLLQQTRLSKEQKPPIERLQATGTMGALQTAFAGEAIQQWQTENQKRRKKRAKKKSALVSGAAGMQLRAQSLEIFKHDSYNWPGTLGMQQPLPSLSLADTSAPTALPSVNGQKKRKTRQRNKNKPRVQHADGVHAGGPFEAASTPEILQEEVCHSNTRTPRLTLRPLPQRPCQPVIDNGKEVSKGMALHVKDRVYQDPQVWDPSTMRQRRVSSEVVPFEYPQEALGLSSAERRVHILAEQQRRESWNEKQETGHYDGTLKNSRVARDEWTALVASVSSADPRYECNARYDGSVDVPSCQRCLDMQEECNRTNGAVPCLHCNNAGIGTEGCVDWRPDGGSMDSRDKSLVDYELPEGDQRLDWDTDLVRRLFGEIE